MSLIRSLVYFAYKSGFLFYSRILTSIFSLTSTTGFERYVSNSTIEFRRFFNIIIIKWSSYLTRNQAISWENALHKASLRHVRFYILTIPITPSNKSTRYQIIRSNMYFLSYFVLDNMHHQESKMHWITWCFHLLLRTTMQISH